MMVMEIAEVKKDHQFDEIRKEDMNDIGLCAD